MSRLMIQLDDRERGALWQLAEIEKRDLRAQAALIIREALERRGLLPVNTPTPTDRDAAQQTGAANYATT